MAILCLCREEHHWFLDNEPERTRISTAARELVLTKHTYDQRAERLLALLAPTSSSNSVPARSWPESHAASAPSIFIPPTDSRPAPHANSAMLPDTVFARQ